MMTSRRPAGRRSAEGRPACRACLRRSWLLETLGVVLDYGARSDGRLSDLLALEDRELLKAAGGRRKDDLATRYASFDPRQMPRPAGVEAVCRHDRRYPRALIGPEAPHLLYVSPSIERLSERTAEPVVAVLGTRHATDYGVEIARSIARGLTASGLTVASGSSDGIAHAAHLGALEAGGGALLVMPGGVDVPSPARRASLYERVKQAGCAVSELPCGSRARRWAAAAAERTLAMIATAVLVVEAEDHWRELAGARIAQALGKPVAAIPGRVTSPASRGTHAMLREGASLVRTAADVLELLYSAGAPTVAGATGEADERGVELGPRLESTLAHVGAGLDTPERLVQEDEGPGDVLLALSELELMGLLTHGDGGRYVPRQAFSGRAVRYRHPGQMEP